MSDDSGGGWGIGSETWHVLVGMGLLVALAIYVYINGGLDKSLPRQTMETVAPVNLPQ